MENIIVKTIKYFKNEMELFNDCIEELDSATDVLYDDRYYEMYMIDDYFHNWKPTEILDKIFLGYDDDASYINESGEHIYKEFNPRRNYFKFNGYANLVSSDYKDYSCFLDEYTITNMSKYRTYVPSIEQDSELSELFDELKEYLKSEKDTDKKEIINN